jgi:hypothetical protein
VATYTRALNSYSLQNAVLTLDKGALNLAKSQAETELLKIPEVWAE